MNEGASYLDNFTEELARKQQEETITPGSFYHMTLLAESLTLLAPDLGMDVRANEAWRQVREEALAADIWPLVFNTACAILELSGKKLNRVEA